MNPELLDETKEINFHSDDNLQPLCLRCSRTKQNNGDTDYRKTNKLVRDNIPEIIKSAGRIPKISTLSGTDLINALKDKLVEEHEEFLAEPNGENAVSELADMLEVIFSLAKAQGYNKEELLEIANKKNIKNGGFEKGYYYHGDEDK